ncbi:MAG: hypothetical protein BWY84_01257 [Candidatus Aerophobetes bacterium ADurb.Bin490]|nr:MAG: hypothetical protein BWY84_01257 [Candidatus Aerophobetes bacterium ADurb.Bin490]
MACHFVYLLFVFPDCFFLKSLCHKHGTFKEIQTRFFRYFSEHLFIRQAVQFKLPLNILAFYLCFGLFLVADIRSFIVHDYYLAVNFVYSVPSSPYAKFVIKLKFKIFFNIFRNNIVLAFLVVKTLNGLCRGFVIFNRFLLR